MLKTSYEQLLYTQETLYNNYLTLLELKRECSHVNKSLYKAIKRIKLKLKKLSKEIYADKNAIL